MNSSDFKKQAKEKLSGKWGKAIVLMLGFVVISLVINLILKNTNGALKSILSLVATIIEVPLAFGFSFSFFKFFNGEEVGAFDFLKLGFQNFKKSWVISLRVLLKLIVPLLILIASYIFLVFTLFGSLATSLSNDLSAVSANFSVGALIALILVIASSIFLTMQSYYYRLAYFVAFDNEDMSSKDVVEKIRKLMEGKRAKLFCLELSFIVLAILAAFTFGIGYLWLIPYIQLSTIAFYKFISESNTTSNE